VYSEITETTRTVCTQTWTESLSLYFEATKGALDISYTSLGNVLVTAVTTHTQQIPYDKDIRNNTGLGITWANKLCSFLSNSKELYNYKLLAYRKELVSQ